MRVCVCVCACACVCVCLSVCLYVCFQFCFVCVRARVYVSLYVILSVYTAECSASFLSQINTLTSVFGAVQTRKVVVMYCQTLRGGKN